MNYLIVIDVQNDFITGSLANAEAVPAVQRIAEKLCKFDGTVVFTRDTHQDDYLETQEGKMLPVPHCIRGSEGWQIDSRIETFRTAHGCLTFDKPTFGSRDMADYFAALYSAGDVESVELCGLDTDICVVSNALLLKAAMPEIPVFVDASCCAGTTPENHDKALNTMKMCQIFVKGE